MTISICKALIAIGLISVAACETAAPRHSSPLSDRQRNGFEALVGLPYPQAFDAIKDYCARDLPPTVERRMSVPVSGYLNATPSLSIYTAVNEFLDRPDQISYVDFQTSRKWEAADLPFAPIMRFTMRPAGHAACAELDAVKRGRGKKQLPEDECIAVYGMDQSDAPLVTQPFQTSTFNSEQLHFSASGVEWVERESGARLGGVVYVTIGSGGMNTDNNASVTCSNGAKPTVADFLTPG
jgi:hypothetical protein